LLLASSEDAKLSLLLLLLVVLLRLLCRCFRRLRVSRFRFLRCCLALRRLMRK
jgi:hypothetical protein